MKNSSKYAKDFFRVEDIMALEHCDYKTAYKKFNECKVYELNGINFIKVEEYLKLNNYEKMYEEYIIIKNRNNLFTKIYIVKPAFYDVFDIMEILKCGKKKAYEILDDCPYTVSFGKLKRVSPDFFEKYAESLQQANMNKDNFFVRFHNDAA